MNLRPIAADEFERVAGWLNDERNSPWLDFGAGRRSVEAVGLKVMCQRDLHCLRVFTPDDDDSPVGLAALSNVDREFGTAEVWAVLGEKEYGALDLTGQAVAQLLEHGFSTMDLQAIFAWTVEVNRGSLRLLTRLGFTPAGRRRRCHAINGKLYDRLLFDLLAEEFQGCEELSRYWDRSRSETVTSTIESEGG
jgi:RimJ/RimL family protein N-acetyltransferase